MPTNKPRFTITVDEELMVAIENFRYDNRIKSQTQAVIKLVELGLQEILKDTPIRPVSAEEQYTAKEKALVVDYRTFNDEGKEKIRDYVADLKDNPKYKKCSKPEMAKQA